MLSVSPTYIAEMGTQTKARKTYGRVEFKQVDLNAAEDATVTATSTESISSPDYTVDDNWVGLSNYATFETDRWVLDGSFALLPTSSPYGELGWWSSELSSTGGTFGTSQLLTFTFTEDHNSIGFTVIFDIVNNEYAVDFTLELLDSSDTQLDLFTITGNTLSTYRVETPVSGYRKAKLTITKWSKEDRRARVSELLFGLIEVYENEELIKLDLTEEIDPTGIQSPQNEFKFSIDNSDYKYDIINPAGIYSYLETKMRITAYIGIYAGSVIEYGKLGTFYLRSWDTPTKIEASFKARDKFDILQNTYKKGLYQTRSLYDLAIDVLTEEGLTSEDYDIDSALSSISVTSYLPIAKTRELLHMIAQAGQAICYMSRDNLVTIKQLPTTDSGLDITFDNAYNPPQVTLDNTLKQLDVNVYGYEAEVDTSTIFKGAITLDGTQDVWVTYKDPATGGSASVDVGTINSATYYTNAALLNITHTGTVTITITGYKLDKYSYPISISNEETGDEISIENQLVTDNAQALLVANWILTEKNKRKKLKTDWRQNPAIETGDIIDIETQFLTYNGVRVTKQLIEYGGALKGYTEVRG